MQDIAADPKVGLDAAIKAVPELASARTTQAAILDATIESWTGPVQEAKGLGAHRRRRLGEVDRVPDHARVVPNPVTVRTSSQGYVPGRPSPLHGLDRSATRRRSRFRSSTSRRRRATDPAQRGAPVVVAARGAGRGGRQRTPQLVAAATAPPLRGTTTADVVDRRWRVHRPVDRATG